MHHRRFSRDMVAITSRTSRLKCGRPPGDGTSTARRGATAADASARSSPASRRRGARASRCRSGEPGPRAACPSSEAEHVAAPEGAGSGPRVGGAAGRLEDDVLARAHPGHDGREQQPDEFEHVLSIADLHSRGVLPPNTAWLGAWLVHPPQLRRPA
jgi:hypothetical protein